jgi:hypothetical protein
LNQSNFRGLSQSRYRKEQEEVKKATKRYQQARKQSDKEERERGAAKAKLISTVRQLAVKETKRRRIPGTAILFAFKSEEKPSLDEMVPFMVDDSWFDSLSRDLWFYGTRSRTRRRRGRDEGRFTESTVYFFDAAGYAEPLHRRITGALICRVSFRSGDGLDCRRTNLTIHRSGYGDEHDLRKMCFSGFRVKRNKSTGAVESIPVRMVTLYDQFDLDAPLHTPDGEEIDASDFITFLKWQEHT